MPDGRPLTAVLEQQQLRPHRSGGGGSRRRPGQVHEPKEGWTKPLPRAAQQTTAAAGAWVTGFPKGCRVFRQWTQSCCPATCL